MLENLQATLQSGLRDGLPDGVPVESHGVTAHRFQNTRALRRTLLAATYFVADARACFENLSDFYREFLREFLGESISVPTSRELIPAFSTAGAWATKLWTFRNDLLHDQAPWLAFDVTGTGSVPQLNTILTLDWRHGTTGQGLTIALRELTEIRQGLGEALVGVRDSIVLRLESKEKRSHDRGYIRP
jgi:hypothetical protein